MTAKKELFQIVLDGCNNITALVVVQPKRETI
jgi:hypothetical protein